MNKQILLTLFAVCMMGNSSKAMETLNNKGVKVALGIGAALTLQAVARTGFGEGCCEYIGFSPKATANTLGFSLAALTGSIFCKESISDKLVYAAYAAPFIGIVNNILNKDRVKKLIGKTPWIGESLRTPKPSASLQDHVQHYKDYGAISALILVFGWEITKHYAPLCKDYCLDFLRK